MTLFRRAALYLVRRRGKTLTLLAILFVVAVLALSGWAIRGAAQTAQLNVRQALGGTFQGDPINAELGERIAAGVAGIKGYSASISNVLIPETADGSAALELVEGEDGDAALAAAYEGDDFGRTVQFYAVTDSTWDSYFANGYLKPVDGAPVAEDSGEGVLVSRQFAELNGIGVGDSFSLRRATVHAQMMGVDVEDTRTPVRVAGIFEPTSKSTAQLSSWMMDNAIFGTMQTLDHARPGTADEGYERLSFQVDDPGELDRIVGEVEALDAVAGHGYVVSADTSDVDAVTAPLENMDRLVTVLVVASVAVGGVVLFLVLSGRVCDRMHESGVLLSLGLSRGSVVGQYLVEVLVVAAVAFALAAPVSAVAAQGVGAALLGYANASAVSEPAGDVGSIQTNDGVSVLSGDPFAPQFERAHEVTAISVKIGPASAAALYGVGLSVAAVAVLLASVPLHRLEPREIMTKLS